MWGEGEREKECGVWLVGLGGVVRTFCLEGGLLFVQGLRQIGLDQ